MISLVSNMPRSGSSMLMRCLEAGGLHPIYDKEADEMNKSAPADYVPNPNGFYEFNHEVTDKFAEIYDGKLIKCPIRSLVHLPIAKYRLAFIKRDPREIRISMGKWAKFRSWGHTEAVTYLYEEYLGALFKSLLDRGDFEITILNYNNIIASPFDEFQKLALWGVNVKKMIDKVDISLYRSKI